MRRAIAVFCALFLCAPAASAAAEPITFAVSEGAESVASVSELVDRYEGLSKRIGAALKRPVSLLPTTRIPVMQQALADGKADLAWIWPANVTADAMANHGYTLVASAEGQFYSAFVVSKSSALKSVKDLEGKRVMHPPAGGVIYRLGAAELRDQGVHALMNEQRLQEVIIFSVENGFTDAGLVNPRQAAKFKQAGGRILHETRKFPYWALIASKKISPQDVEALTKLMLSINAAPWGKDIRTSLQVQSFVAPDPKGYLDLKAWTEK